MSRNLIELIRALNESEQFKSPKKGFLIQNEKCSGLNCLNDGTKKLIAIADTFHDFSHLQKSNLFSNWTYKPGNNLLRKWALNIIQDIDISETKDIDISETKDKFNKQTIINTIFSNPEEFVYLYLYWNDFFYYKKGSDIEDIKEIDANTNIIILDMPNNCGNNEEDIKEKSKEIVKNYFEKIQNNSEFKFKNSGKIKENDLAYTMDQGGKDEIFTSGNFWKIQGLLINNKTNDVMNTNIFKCHTPGCNVLFCYTCYNKIKKNSDYDDESEPYSYNNKFKCPYCRNIDFKDYMKHNVLNQMMCKILTPEEACKLFYNI